jgi:hypothetical protein
MFFVENLVLPNVATFFNFAGSEKYTGSGVFFLLDLLGINPRTLRKFAFFTFGKSDRTSTSIIFFIDFPENHSSNGVFWGVLDLVFFNFAGSEKYTGSGVFFWGVLDLIFLRIFSPAL